MTTAVDKSPAYARLSAVASAGDLPTAPTPRPGTQPWTEGGGVLRDKRGRDGTVEWKRLTDRKSDRLLLAYGHALTVDSAQGIKSGEHINALPRGTAGATSFKTYVAESRHLTQVHTLIAVAAVFEVVKMRRALGDVSEVTTEDLCDRVADDMSTRPARHRGCGAAPGARSG